MREIVYRGNYMTVTEEEIYNHIYERVELRPGVQVIPYYDEKILLMNEYRTHEKSSRWKLVSGWIDKPNKTPLHHAKEELAEEIGFEAMIWNELPQHTHNNFTVSSTTHFFTCSDLRKLEHPPENPDNSEVLEYEWFSFDEIFEMLQEKKIVKDGAILTALCYLRNQIKNKKA